VRRYHDEDVGAKLREPKGRFQEIVRALADAAMAVTQHDSSSDEPGYIHAVQSMERRFTNILRGKIKP
jgi:hypothetical protein